jgi:Domain of unknown function (DUF4156)
MNKDLLHIALFKTVSAQNSDMIVLDMQRGGRIRKTINLMAYAYLESRNSMTRLTLLFCCVMISSCSLIQTKQVIPGAQTVRLYEDATSLVADCTFLGEIIGSEGHWYNYLFMSNKNLAQGAINDIKNEAWNLGANSVHAHINLLFATSVTIVGQAYRC